jgi:hypothetical protein
MAAPSLAPTEFRPDRDTVWLAVAALGAAAVFGLWRGFAHEWSADQVAGREAAAADLRDPAAVEALPLVSAATDTLIPAQAQAEPATPPSNAAPSLAAGKPTAERESPTQPPSRAAPEPVPEADDAAAASSVPTLQVLEKDPVDTQPPAAEAPPDDGATISE